MRNACYSLIFCVNLHQYSLMKCDKQVIIMYRTAICTTHSRPMAVSTVTTQQGEPQVYLWTRKAGSKGEGIRDSSTMAYWWWPHQSHKLCKGTKNTAEKLWGQKRVQDLLRRYRTAGCNVQIGFKTLPAMPIVCRWMTTNEKNGWPMSLYTQLSIYRLLLYK